MKIFCGFVLFVVYLNFLQQQDKNKTIPSNDKKCLSTKFFVCLVSMMGDKKLQQGNRYYFKIKLN